MVVATVVLALASSVQLLYLESQRLRTRDLPSLSFFKDMVEEKIGLETEHGALSFSLIKHATLAVLGALVLADFLTRPLTVLVFLEACFISVLLMLVAGNGITQILYRINDERWLT